MKAGRAITAALQADKQRDAQRVRGWENYYKYAVRQPTAITSKSYAAWLDRWRRFTWIDGPK